MVDKLKFGAIPDTQHRVTWRTVWKEFLLIVDLFAFMLFSSYIYVLQFPISLVFLGRSSTAYLEAAGLGNTLFSAFGILIYSGLATGCETTMSQSYGTANKIMVGVYFQKGLLLYGCVLLISIAFIINAEPIMVLLGQNREIARLAGQYVSVLSLGLHGVMILSLTQRYFRIQNVIRVAIISGLFNVLASLLCHYLFLDVWQFGVEGSAYAQVIAYWSSSLLVIVMTPLHRKVIRTTWGGFTTESLQDWRKLSSLSFAGVFIICLQWWGLEICTLLAGTLGDLELAAQSLLFQINYFLYSVPISIGISCNILIGQHVGENRPKLGQLCMRIGWIFSWVMSGVNVLALLLLRNILPTIFTTDQALIDLTSDTVPYLALYHAFECTVTVSQGMGRGIARQKMGSIASFIGYYVIGMPMAYLLTFEFEMGIKGLWAGLAIGLAFESVLIVFLLMRTDWRMECRAAQIRAGLDPDKVEEHDNDPYYSEVSDDEHAPLVGTTAPARRFKKRYNAEYASSQPDITILAKDAAFQRLTPAQLLVYRGGLFAVCILILTIGIICHFNLQLPYYLVDISPSTNITQNATDITNSTISS